jgi:hypothetical protein
MSLVTSLARNKAVLLRMAVALLIGLGIVLRLAMFFHNRNLIIDEANIVRNLAERGFGALVLPLKYEQFAPPVFLWIEKLASLLFGYGEKAMRLYPLLCGLGTLFLFPAVARKLMSAGALLLPLAYLAGGFVFLKYSAELKQYMPDTFIALLLIWLALRWDIHKMSIWRFALYWALAGSIAIWSSMPSVFILAGIGGYYGISVLKAKRYVVLIPLAIAAGVWLLQFALYYFTILKSQIGSSYLQNYHLEYFLFATPTKKDEWLHNWMRIEDILGNVGGWSGVAVVSNLLFFLVGAVYLFRKRLPQFMLIALPIVLVLIAAALKQFSLIDRVILFSFPLWGLVIGVGLEWIWNLKLPVRALLIIVGGYNAQAYAATHLLRHSFELHEITKGMDWIIARGGRGEQLYVHDASVPTYIYYTELHPQRAKWSSLLGARRLKWETDYAEITRGQRDTTYFLYTGGFPGSEKDKRTKQIEQNMQQVAYFEYAICYVYVYVPKSVQDTVAIPSGTTPN